MRPARALVLLLLSLLALARPAAAQQTPDVDALLQWQDRMVLARYQQTYVSDMRYVPVLRRISARLNPHLTEVYPRNKPVSYYVFLGRMGFNAQTWTNIIIFDTLLLDAMHNLAQGIAVYGTTDCEYVHRLAQYVAQIDMACRSGRYGVHIASSNGSNPYVLPTLWGLTPAQRERADDLFEEMLAGWMAHEGSHAFLDHNRERVEAQRLLWLYNQQAQAPPEAVRQYISSYLSYDTSRQKEREADEHGIHLILNAGYGIDGLIYTFEFAQLLEELTGEARIQNRTHPTPLERIVLARQLAGNEPPSK